jgi:hypothetical protein
LFEVGADPVRDIGGSAFGEVSECFVEPIVFGFVSESIAVTEGEHMSVFVCEHIGEMLVESEVGIEIDHVGSIGSRRRKVCAEVVCSNETSDGSPSILQVSEDGREQDCESMVAVNIRRRSDQSISGGHDRRLESSDNLFGQCDSRVRQVGGFIEVDDSALSHRRRSCSDSQASSIIERSAIEQRHVEDSGRNASGAGCRDERCEVARIIEAWCQRAIGPDCQKRWRDRGRLVRASRSDLYGDVVLSVGAAESGDQDNELTVGIGWQVKECNSVTDADGCRGVVCRPRRVVLLWWSCSGDPEEHHGDQPSRQSHGSRLPWLPGDP